MDSKSHFFCFLSRCRYTNMSALTLSILGEIWKNPLLFVGAETCIHFSVIMSKWTFYPNKLLTNLSYRLSFGISFGIHSRNLLTTTRPPSPNRYEILIHYHSVNLYLELELHWDQHSIHPTLRRNRNN